MCQCMPIERGGRQTQVHPRKPNPPMDQICLHTNAQYASNSAIVGIACREYRDQWSEEVEEPDNLSREVKGLTLRALLVADHRCAGPP